MSKSRFSFVAWMTVLALFVGGSLSSPAVYAQTVDEAKAKVDEMPEDPARHYNLGVIYFKNSKYNESIASFQEAVKLQEDYKEAFYNMGLAQQKINQHSPAIKSLKAATDLDGTYADAFAALGNSYRKKGQNTAAARAYSSALKIVPNKADWHYNLGIVYQTQQNYEKALSAYKDYMKHESQKNSKRYKQIVELSKTIEEHYLTN